MKSKLLIILAHILFLIPVTAFAADTKKPFSSGNISIDSDRVLYDTKNKKTIFHDNVVVTTDDTKITCSKLVVFFNKKNASATSITKVSSDSVERLEATGNVIMQVEGKTATADKAEYFLNREMLILSGGRPTLIDGNDSIEGDKITYDLANETLEIVKLKNQQVKAVFTNK